MIFQVPCIRISNSDSTVKPRKGTAILKIGALRIKMRASLKWSSSNLQTEGSLVYHRDCTVVRSVTLPKVSLRFWGGFKSNFLAIRFNRENGPITEVRESLEINSRSQEPHHMNPVKKRQETSLEGSNFHFSIKKDEPENAVLFES